MKPMKHIARIGVAAMAAFGICAAANGQAKLPLKILYAGIEKDDRTPGIMDFLKEHFERVGFAPFTEFKPEMADGYNVVIFNAPMPRGRNVPMPRAPKLPKDFNRASVLIASGGANVARELNLKIDWLCTCLDGPAHNVVMQHPIFKTPYVVEMQLKELATPKWYEHWVPLHSLPKTISSWKVQEVETTDRTAGIGSGVIMMGKGFLDSPDCEFIAGGMNMKDLEGMAIGRQGSFFYWGFEAPPAQLTPSGREAFLNSIVYAAKFDRAPVLVHRVTRPREWVMAHINEIRNIRAQYDQQVEIKSYWVKRIADLKEKAKTQTLTAQEEGHLKLKPVMPPPFEEYRRRSMERTFPAAVLNQCGMDTESLYAYYKANYPYLIPGTTGNDRSLEYVVDEDAKALGLPNTDVRLLDRCVELLLQGQDKDRALRILRRYTFVNFASPQEWQAWLDQNRSRLFFSDYGGFKFYSNGPGVAPALPQASAPKATEANPAVFSASGTATGDVVTLTVNVALADGWHLYARTPEGSPFRVTKMEAKLPKGAIFLGDWSQPPVHTIEEGLFTIEGNQAFTRKVKLPAGMKGSIKIPVTVSWQTCNSEQCLPPEVKSFAVSVNR